MFTQVAVLCLLLLTLFQFMSKTCYILHKKIVMFWVRSCYIILYNSSHIFHAGYSIVTVYSAQSTDKHYLSPTVMMEMRINCKKVTYGTSQLHTDESLDDPSSPPASLTSKILKLIEKVYLKTHNPSGPDEENKFQEFMAELGPEIADTFLGSLVITLKINSLQILENLWNVYCSGYLGKKVQSCLATDYVLNKLNLRELQLETTILKEDYEVCRRHFTQSLGKFLTIFLT